MGGDERIVIGQGVQGIVRVSANGGRPETIVKVEKGEVAHGPQMLPDGEHILFTLTKAVGSARKLLAGRALDRLEVPKSEDLVRKGWHFWNRRTREGFEKAAACFRQAVLKMPRIFGRTRDSLSPT